MAFTYRYADDTPPAPFVLVILARPDGAARTADLPARLDTGADRTVVPARLASDLGLDESERLTFAGFGGQQVELPIYEVRLTVRDLPPVDVRVAASESEPHVLLGRDVLNRYKIVLDCPNLRLEIG
jgi:predicted aspartyl protease